MNSLNKFFRKTEIIFWIALIAFVGCVCILGTVECPPMNAKDLTYLWWLYPLAFILVYSIGTMIVCFCLMIQLRHPKAFE